MKKRGNMGTKTYVASSMTPRLPMITAWLVLTISTNVGVKGFLLHRPFSVLDNRHASFPLPQVCLSRGRSLSVAASSKEDSSSSSSSSSRSSSGSGSSSATTPPDKHKRQSLPRNTKRKRSTTSFPSNYNQIKSNTNSHHHHNPNHQNHNKKYKKKKPFAIPSLSEAIELNKSILSCQSSSEALGVFVSKGGARGVAANGAFNSINLSTMIHRVSKLSTSPNPGGGGGGARGTATVLADPRFAILLCAIAEALANDVDAMMAQPTQPTSQSPSPKRRRREAYGEGTYFFGCRELSNVAWALAKMKRFLVPAHTEVPLVRHVPPKNEYGTAPLQYETTAEGNPYNVHPTTDLTNFSKQLRETSAEIRASILRIAQNRQNANSNNNSNKEDSNNKHAYIPTLRQLTAHLFDSIALRASSPDTLDVFNNQELANVVWAFATVKRGDDVWLQHIAHQLLLRHQQQTVSGGKSLASSNRHGMMATTMELKPQELSNIVWALATQGVSGWQQVQFVQFVADKMSTSSSSSSSSSSHNTDEAHDAVTFVKKFKAQELSNTAWGCVTMLAKRWDSNEKQNASPASEQQEEEQKETQAVYRILRIVAEQLCLRPHEFKPQEISNTLWALSTVKFGVPLGSTIHNNGNHDGNHGDVVFCQEDRNLALDTLWQAGLSAMNRLRQFSPQELNNMAWSFARLLDMNNNNNNNHHPVLSAMLGNDTLEAAERREQQERMDRTIAVAHQVFHGIGSEVMRRTHTFSSQDIGTTLWSFATMGYTATPPSDDEDNVDNFEESKVVIDYEHMRAVYQTGASRVNYHDAHLFKPQELSNSIWALATAGMIPEVLDVFDTTLDPNSREDYDEDYGPITTCFGAVARSLMHRPWEFKEQEVKDVLWSFSRVGMRHPDLFRSVATHLVGSHGEDNNDKTNHGGEGERGLGIFTAQGIGNLAWSYAKQAQLTVDRVSGGNLPQQPGSSSTGRLAVYEISCSDLGGEILLARLFAAIAESSLSDNGGLGRFNAQDMSNTVWAFAILGLVHVRFFNAVAEQVVQRVVVRGNNRSNNSKKKLSSASALVFKPQEIANLVWSFATLNVRAPAMMEAISSYVVSLCNRKANNDGVVHERNVAKLFNRQELANLAWSCAVLQSYPPKLMDLLFVGLVGRSGQNPEYMNEVMQDGGLSKQTLMSLLYVQLALDLEAPELGLSLPENFPVGWGERTGASMSSSPSSARGGSSSVTDGFLQDGPTLDVNPSRLQNLVSQALERVGFDHIQEHTFGFDNQHHQHGNGNGNNGIETPAARIDFLSIDIANVEQKIGIEVDGPAHYVHNVDETLASTEASSTTTSITSRTSTNGNGNGSGNGKGNPRWLGRRIENGPTTLKHRVLSRMGWSLAHMPFWEWNMVSGDAEAEEKYCRQILEKVDMAS